MLARKGSRTTGTTRPPLASRPVPPFHCRVLRTTASGHEGDGGGGMVNTGASWWGRCAGIGLYGFGWVRACRHRALWVWVGEGMQA